MKIKVVSDRAKLDDLTSDDTYLHLSFRPSVDDLLRTILPKTRNHLKAIQLTEHITVSPNFIKVLEQERICLLRGHFMGCKTYDDYFYFPDLQAEKVRRMSNMSPTILFKELRKLNDFDYLNDNTLKQLILYIRQLGD